MASFEVLLPIGAIGVYLYDAVLMLYGNELVLERHGRGWRSSSGLPLQFGGRRIFLPNPFAPGALLFRVRWHTEGAQPEGKQLDIPELLRLTRPLRIVVLLQALLLFVALAPISIILGAGNLLLLIFAVFYGLSFCAIGVLVVRRQALKVANRRCALLAFEAFACAPFAVNLVRKVTLARSPDLPWLQVAEESFSAAERLELAHCISQQVDVLLMGEEPGSAKETRLEFFRADLRERLGVTIPA